MDRTPFAGLTRLDPADPLSADDFSFQSQNPRILDALLRLAVQSHRHDGHAALADPTLDPTVGTLDTGGTIPADTAITVGYTLLDADGGETSLNSNPQLVTTQGGLATPDAGPDLAWDTVAGALIAGTYAYAVTVIDGLGGETLLGPSSDITINPGSATNRIALSGLSQIVTDTGGTGWRLWRSINGDAWGLLSAGAGATDTFTDDGTTPVDCGSSPPVVGTGNTNSTSRLQVSVPTGQPAGAVQFSIYASLDGQFGSPSLLGTYPVADLGTTKTYSSLTAISDGAPPLTSRAYPGADPIDAATDLINMTWLPPVANAGALPVGDPDGAVRVTLDDFTAHIFELAGPTWHPVGGGGGGGGTSWKAPVTNSASLPGVGNTAGDVRLALDTGALWFWNGTGWFSPGVDNVMVNHDHTTASLANNASENYDAGVGRVAVIGLIFTDRAARLELYTTSSKRTSDAGRAFGTPPTGDHGVILDVQTAGGGGFFFFDPAPAPVATNSEDTAARVRARVTNISGSTGVINVSISHLRLA